MSVNVARGICSPRVQCAKLTDALAHFLFAMDHGEVTYASADLGRARMADICVIGGLVRRSPAEKNFIALAYSGKIVDRTRQSQ